MLTVSHEGRQHANSHISKQEECVVKKGIKMDPKGSFRIAEGKY